MFKMTSFLTYLKEGIAHDMAKRLGLQYYGFGRYGRDDHVTHTSHADHLVPVKSHYSIHKGGPLLLHYEHLEDQIFNQGVSGARSVIDTLHGLINHNDRIATQTKIDGAPSLFMGKHPTTGKFFIATKSLFNKDAKINSSHEDIDRNHGHSHGLAEKLHAALDHLPKIFKGDGIVQGDMMYDKPDVDVRVIGNEPHYTFKPNVTRNAIRTDSKEGAEIARSKIGIAIHTKYNKDNERLPADHTDVKNHPDVFVMKIDAPSPKSTIHKAALAELGKMIAVTPKQSFEFAQKHATLLKQYVNHKIKQGGGAGSSDDFINWVHDYKQKEIDKVKTDKSKMAKAADRDEYLAELHHNVSHLNNVFGVHSKIANLKDSVIDAFDKHQKVQRFFDKDDGIEKTGPEGYVAIGSHGTHKLVKRKEFSFANFTQAKNWSGPKADHAVVTLGRMSPPHVDHSNLIDAVKAKAKTIGADPYVYVTHTQDNKKNPLTATEKLEVLNAMYPNNKDVFAATSTKAPSLVHVLADLHQKGYKDVTVVLGDDRMKDFEFLNKYNGVFNDKGQGYKFNSINIMSRHAIQDTRDGESDGVHATDLRKAAQSDDFPAFRKGMHKNVSDELTRTIMKKIKDRLK